IANNNKEKQEMNTNEALYNVLQQLAKDIIDMRRKMDTLQAELFLIAARVIEEAEIYKEATWAEIRAIELVREHFERNGYTTHADTLKSLLDTIEEVQR